ncbi:MAG: hypothetical protein U5N53_09545 [Mycobacterium sp.]|nr:hypothetical protein [Mycobacterium sp.]
MRNVKPLWSRFGTLFGAFSGGVDMWLTTLVKWSPFGTMQWQDADHRGTKPLSAVTAMEYARPDAKLTLTARRRSIWPPSA